MPSDSMQRMVFKVVLSSVAFFGQSFSIDPSSFLFFTVSVRVPMNFLKDDGKNDRAPQVSNPIVANSVCKLLPFPKCSIVTNYYLYHRRLLSTFDSIKLVLHGLRLLLSWLQNLMIDGSKGQRQCPCHFAVVMFEFLRGFPTQFDTIWYDT